jgi:hypothetical protein
MAEKPKSKKKRGRRPLTRPNHPTGVIPRGPKPPGGWVAPEAPKEKPNG